MCNSELSGQTLAERMNQRRKCLSFYMKSFEVFEENVKDKLKSLINKLDYFEL
jgi:DNA-binding MltR family transcriptional regulator